MDLLFRVSTIKGYMVSQMFAGSLCTFVRMSAAAQAKLHSLTLMSAWAPKSNFTWVKFTWPCLLSDRQLVHPQWSCHSCFQWRIHLCFWSCCSHHVCWADASSPMQAVGIVLLEFIQLFATCFCNMQSFLWVWLSQTECILTSYCFLSDIFLFKPFTLWGSLQPCWPLSVSKL